MFHNLMKLPEKRPRSRTKYDDFCFEPWYSLSFFTSSVFFPLPQIPLPPFCINFASTSCSAIWCSFFLFWIFPWSGLCQVIHLRYPDTPLMDFCCCCLLRLFCFNLSLQRPNESVCFCSVFLGYLISSLAFLHSHSPTLVLISYPFFCMRNHTLPRSMLWLVTCDLCWLSSATTISLTI